MPIGLYFDLIFQMQHLFPRKERKEAKNKDIFQDADIQKGVGLG